MATLERLEAILKDILDTAQRIEARDRISAHCVNAPGGLSDITNFLGTVTAGEFRTGNGADPGKGFSGVRIAYPTMTYANQQWNVVGVDNDTIQFGIRASDGVAMFGGGIHFLDADGYTIYDATGTGKRPEILFKAGAAPTEYGRIAGYSAGANIASAYVTSNAYFDGTNWNIDDATRAGTIFQGSSNADVGGIAFQWRSVPEGANPRTPVTLMTVNHSGMFQNRVAEATIAAGVLTIECNRTTVDTQGDNATDDLDTINLPTGNFYGAAGALIVLSPASGARTVVVKNSTGNVYLAGSDFTMDNVNDCITLAGTADGTGWLEVARANNGA